MADKKSPQEDSFVLVKSQRRQKRGAKHSTKSPVAIDSIEQGQEAEDRLTNRINETITDLISSTYFIDAFAKLKSTTDTLQNKYSSSGNITAICFGIGRFSDCAISRHQLAFLLAIKQQLQITSIVFHEPLLNVLEVNILRKFNCTACEKNLEGKVDLDSNCITIVYSPHCPKQLTNNLLWHNWLANRLLQTIYIGNSFSHLVDSTPSRFLSIDASYITHIEPYCTEIRLDNNFKFTDIFNDTSIHFFNKIEGVPDDFWLNRQEPVYQLDCVELITSDIINKLNI